MTFQIVECIITLNQMVSSCQPEEYLTEYITVNAALKHTSGLHLS